MMHILIISIPWIMSIIALIGTIINARANKWGFVLWTISNLYMAYINYRAGLYAIGTLFVIYFLLAIYGLYHWGKQEDNKPGETYAMYDSESREIICQNCCNSVNYSNKYCSECGNKFINFKNNENTQELDIPKIIDNVIKEIPKK